MAMLNRRGCEEVEIQFIDGDAHLAGLASSANIHQGNVEFWYEELEDPDETESVQLAFLLECGYGLTEALEF